MVRLRNSLFIVLQKNRPALKELAEKWIYPELVKKSQTGWLIMWLNEHKRRTPKVIEQPSNLEAFYLNQSLLDVLFLAAKDLREPVPIIPAMPDEAQRFLNKNLGRLTLSSWAVAAIDTKTALDSFTELSFGDVTVAELAIAIDAQTITLSTLRERVCHDAGVIITRSHIA